MNANIDTNNEAATTTAADEDEEEKKEDTHSSFDGNTDKKKMKEETPADAVAASYAAAVAAAAATNNIESNNNSNINNNNNNKDGPPPKPSYYSDSFHEHFFPNDGVIDDREGGLASSTTASGLPLRKPLSIPQRYATSMARRPWTHLLTAFTIAFILSFIGLRFGNFTVAIDNSGWWSRGTNIANRATQDTILSNNRYELWKDESGVWEALMTVNQPNWQTDTIGEEGEEEEVEVVDNTTVGNVCSGAWYGSKDMVQGKEKNLVALWKTDDATEKEPKMSMLDAASLYELCVAEENTLAALESSDSCYKCDSSGNVFDGGKCIEPYSLVLMARQHLANNDISQMSTLSNSISCDSLRASWTPTTQQQFTTALKTCVNWSIRKASSGGGNANQTITIQDTTITVTDPCPFPFKFVTTVVDELFPDAYNNDVVRYSSSYYATKKSNSDVKIMFEASKNDEYDQSSGEDSPSVEGVYDTSDQDFYDIYSDEIVGRDMALAVGSAGVTVIAMLLHTKSPFLTLAGLLQILLSFPLAYFVYYFIGGLVFFPFLNFIGIFVVFALGADDVFVAVDKWKNARHELPSGTTEQVAALALPDAAYAMLLTSTTTAVAFFGTAICPVGPIVCFAVFCGLLITFDFMMNIFLVFPALCLYDKWLLAGSQNCCVNFDWCCRKADSEEPLQLSLQQQNRPANGIANDVEGQVPMEQSTRTSTATNVEGEDVEESARTFASDRGAAGRVKGHQDPDAAERAKLIEVEHKSFIHRILDSYYKLLHRFRWLVLGITAAGFITCTVFAAQLTLPTSSDVAILPDKNQYQMHWVWNENLLSTKLAKEAGTEARIWFGVTPADTGDHLNPDSWTTLVLDETFEVKSEESQLYLLDFCGRLFAEFGEVEDTYQCPMNLFDEWLKEQSELETPTQEYTQNCNGASAVPVPPNVFDPCMISFSKHTNNASVLSTDGSVKIMEVRSKSKNAFDAPFKDLKDEWTSYENWLDNERNSAPNGVNKMFHSNIGFWWFDTNQQMLRTAYGAAAIALVCAAVIVFISSRSFALTLFAAVAICYVLVAATACLVGLGWELGFLESILFAILIGISCDFVLHFGHAYTMYSGSVDRGHRSHFSLTHMGPSILAAAFTTFAAAVVMVFTEITFFQKFAVMLFMTIVHSTLGCFVVFLVLCDCFGPAEPTKGYDTIKAKLCGKKD